MSLLIIFFILSFSCLHFPGDAMSAEPTKVPVNDKPNMDIGLLEKKGVEKNLKDYVDSNIPDLSVRNKDPAEADENEREDAAYGSIVDSYYLGGRVSEKREAEIGFIAWLKEKLGLNKEEVRQIQSDYAQTNLPPKSAENTDDSVDWAHDVRFCSSLPGAICQGGLNKYYATPTPLVSVSPAPSQQAGISPSPAKVITVTPVSGSSPTPSQSGNLVADSVNSMMARCIYNSRPAVNMTNKYCLDTVIPKLPLGPKGEFVVSVNDFNYLQCVGFVRGVKYLETGFPLVGGGGNAIDYASKPPNGYIFVRNNGINQPRSGDLAVWSYGTYGHIAFVDNVYTPQVFSVYEANFDYFGGIRKQNHPVQNQKLVGWVRKS